MTDVEPGHDLHQEELSASWNFGAFVELAPEQGRHGSYLQAGRQTRVAKVEDVVNVGDEVTVKVR